MAGRASLQNLWVLMVTAFVDTLGAFLVLALLPFYAERFGASPLEIGALVAAFALAQMITAPLWGRLSDRWGRRPVILAGLAISAVAYLVFAFADSLWLLLLSRLGQGIGGGTIAVIFAYVTDAVVPSERASGIGWLTSATSAAAMVGPAVGSLSGRLDPAAPGLVTAALCLVNLVFAWRLLPETAPAREPEPPHGARERPGSLRRALFAVLRHPTAPVSSLVWVYTVGMLALTALTGIVALYLERRFGITEKTIWMFFAYVGGISILVRIGLLGPLVRRFGEVRVLRLGALTLAVGMLSVPLATSTVSLALAVALVPIGTSFLFPCTTALVSRQAPNAREVGLVMGVQQAFGGGSKILGPIWAGAAFQHLSIDAPFWIGGVLVLLVGIASVGLSPPPSIVGPPPPIAGVDPASPEGL